jgi:hypothetical protein
MRPARLVVYGVPSPQLKEALAGLSPVYMPPFGKDFEAGDNLTLLHRGVGQLSETEIKLEAIEPGQCRVDTFLSEFVGQIFVLLA